MSKKDIQIMKTAFMLAVASFFGWLVFNGINKMFPQLQELEPVGMIGIGIFGIWFLTRMGLKK